MRLKPVLSVLGLIFILCTVPAVCGAADYSVFKERPRLYFNKQKLEKLRSVRADVPYSYFLKVVRKMGKGQVGSRVPNNLIRFDASTLRRPADGLLNLTFYYLITRDSTVFSTIEDLLRTFSVNPDWAGNEDMGPAHVLYSMSLAYDWLYDELSSPLRLLVKDAIADHAQIFYDLTRKKKIWWSQSKGLLQNHNYVNVASMAIAGIALHGEDPRAARWLDEAQKNFDAVLGLLSPDGASHEGIGYWSYGTLWLLNYYMALAPAQGLDKVKKSGFFKNTAKFRLYASLPGFRYNIDYADSLIIDYYGPGAFLRCLASIFNDGHAQWLATEIEQQKRKRSILWQDYIWYDPEVKPVSPENLPRYGWFDNLGILLSRSSWDKDASLLMFKAGPPQGFLALSKGVYPGSHIHPDEGTYSLWSGRNALVQDDSYVLKKLSSSHNILTFNKQGQLGEGGAWFLQYDYKKDKGSIPRPKFSVGNNYQIVEVELAGLYPSSVRPRSWKRTVAVINGADVFIRDKVVPARSVQVEYPIHLTRKARKSGGVICLDYGKGYSFDFRGEGVSHTFKRYSLPTKSMGKNIPRIGMMYKAARKTAAPFSMLTAIARADEGCSVSATVISFDTAQDSAVVKCISGNYKIEFTSLRVDKI